MSLTTNKVLDGQKRARAGVPRSTRIRFRPMILDRLEERLVLAPAPTTLAVSAVSGMYGGTATVTANLSSTGTPVAGESVDLHIGATDLGPVVTDTNGNATIPAASLSFINVGTYTGDVTASFAGDASFDPASGSNDLTVTPAPLTITANNQTKVYGAALPTLTASYTGFVNGDTAANLTTSPTLTTTATAASHVAGSPYSITASGAVGSNYTISYVAGSLNVTRAPLTITANNQTKVYGAALPTLTASYTGFVNGDTAANLATPATVTTTATAASHVAGSPYSITASGAVDPDYTISYVAGSLSVTRAPLTITANNQSKVYGAALPTLTVSYTGFVNGDTGASLTTPATVTTTATAASHVSGNPYSITASGAVDTDYTISYVSGSLSVTAAPLTITADDQTKVYGAALPTLTASYTGLVNGDTSASLGTLPTLATTADAASHVSGNPYSITASGAVAPDYTISYVAGSLTVTAAPLTITADDLNKVYGAALPTLTASYNGFVNGDTSTSLGTLPTLATTADAASHVSGNPYAITASGAADPDYMISYMPGSLTVTPAPLTISANSATKVYGAAVPAFTASYTGFVNGDTTASLTTPTTVTTTATAASHVSGSPYAITASGAADPDYTFNYVAGSLTVTPAPLTIAADDQTKVYGAALPTLTASYTGFVNGDTSASLATQPALASMGDATSHVSGSPYAITASGAADPDYTISYSSGALTVTPAPLTITANNATKVYGAALPTLTATTSGFVNGDSLASLTTPISLATTADATSHVSGSPYAITASGAADADYTISFAPGTLTVTPAPLTITANSATKVYGAAVPSLASSFSGFVNGDTSASLATQPMLTTSATTTSHVSGSPYAITASGAVDPNYSISYVAGSLSVTPAPLNVTAVNIINSYGQPIPTLTASYSGFVNGDTSASLSTPVQLGTGVTRASHTGVYPITASGAAAGDYAIQYTNGAIAIIPALLTVTPVNVIKTFGVAVPTLTATYSGFFNGDTPASLTNPVALSTTATANSVSGIYPITANNGASGDYVIQYGPGAVAVTTNPGQVAFINSLYLSILGRDAELGTGLNFWLTQLADGVSESNVASGIYNSPEARSFRAAHKGRGISEMAAFRLALTAQAQAV